MAIESAEMCRCVEGRTENPEAKAFFKEFVRVVWHSDSRMPIGSITLVMTSLFCSKPLFLRRNAAAFCGLERVSVK